MMDFPQRRVTRIVRDEIREPGGTTLSFRALAYNEQAGILICGSWRHEDGTFRDVWTYDVHSKERKWIGQRRWHVVSGFAWSEAGCRAAFAATKEQPPPPEGPSAIPPYDEYVGSVYVWDMNTRDLTEVADDALIAYRSQISAPVWTRDGRFLYYVSGDRRIVRLEVATLKKKVIPFSAYAVVTVTDYAIVYIIDHVPQLGGYGAQVVKRWLAMPRNVSGPEVLYTGCIIEAKLVSPSGRFVLLQDWISYYGGGRRVLIDTATGCWYDASYTYEDLFDMDGPAIGRRAGASKE